MTIPRKMAFIVETRSFYCNNMDVCMVPIGKVAGINQDGHVLASQYGTRQTPQTMYSPEYSGCHLRSQWYLMEGPKTIFTKTFRALPKTYTKSIIQKINHANLITSNFCTCHNSNAVVACAKFCGDQIGIYQYTKAIWDYLRHELEARNPKVWRRSASPGSAEWVSRESYACNLGKPHGLYWHPLEGKKT